MMEEQAPALVPLSGRWGIVGGAMLVAGIGGLVASFMERERPEGRRELLPLAVVAIVVPSSGGYLSITPTDAGIILAGRGAAGNEVWRQERAVDIDLYSLRGIGTADGGYLIAGSSIA